MKNIQHPTSNIQHPLALRSRNHWMFVAGCRMLDVPKSVLICAIHVYRRVLSPALFYLFGAGSGCRFTPTCSVYALDALREHGAVAGTVLATKRICRCQPWGGCGHDPVPSKRHAEKVKRGKILAAAHS
jgi:putative membrane protein insertion efficiency factor